MKRCILIVFCLVSSISCAQNFSSSISRINPDAFPSVKAVVKVWSKKPEILTPKNFVLIEDSRKISTCTVSIMKPNQFVIILLDRSSSIEPALRAVKAAASSFAAKMIKTVSICVMSFASDIEYEQSFTSDKKKIIKAIDGIRSWGGTCLYDALYEACSEITVKAGRTDLKTIVCLTDGRDSTPTGDKPISIKKPKDVIAIAKKNNIRLVMLGLGKDIDAAILGDLAKETNGWFLQPKDASDLARLYASISERILLEKYYRLRYTTPNNKYDGKKRTLRITTSTKGQKDTDENSYIAPVLLDSHNKIVKSISMKKVKSTLVLPNSPYLTKEIIAPYHSPVFIPNDASFANLSAEESEEIIGNAIAKITNDCNASLDKQYAYLDDFKQHLEAMKKKIDIIYAKKQYQPFEVARVNFKYELLNNRMLLLDTKRTHCYEMYNLRLQYYLDILALQKRKYVNGEHIPASMYVALRDKRKDAENALNKTYLKKENQLKESLKAINKKYPRASKYEINELIHSPGKSNPKEKIKNNYQKNNFKLKDSSKSNIDKTQKKGIDVSMPTLD